MVFVAPDDNQIGPIAGCDARDFFCRRTITNQSLCRHSRACFFSRQAFQPSQPLILSSDLSPHAVQSPEGKGLFDDIQQGELHSSTSGELVRMT
jgi:hypothetical protein